MFQYRVMLNTPEEAFRRVAKRRGISVYVEWWLRFSPVDYVNLNTNITRIRVINPISQNRRSIVQFQAKICVMLTIYISYFKHMKYI